jgi:aminoglycoside phosphotransferase (APT) family kinase protein
VHLPDHTPVPVEIARAIGERHGLRIDRLVALPTTGLNNAVYLLSDDLVLRVPRNDPAFAGHVRREAEAIPVAHAAGVRTPALVAFDDRLDLLPVPYLIVERVEGQPLEELRPEPADAPETWREVGRDLARLHGATPADLAGEGGEHPDPRPLVGPRVADGWLSARDGDWLLRWLTRIAGDIGPPAPRRLTHADVQGTNVLVGADAGYRALIDWGCAHRNDPALDFVGMPLPARRSPWPAIVRSRRSMAPGWPRPASSGSTCGWRST